MLLLIILMLSSIFIISTLSVFTDKRIEHFVTKDFFYEKVKTWSVSCREWDRDIIDKLIVEPHIYSDADPDYILDIIVPNGNLFLGALVSNPVIILVPNTQRIFDFSEFTKVDCFRMGLTHGTNMIWDALKTLLDPQAVSRIMTYNLSETEAINRYGNDIDGLLMAPKLSPLQYIRTITSQTPSHLLYFNQINSGNYFILDHEKEFYHNHPVFQKYLLDLNTFKKQYPSLTTVKKDLYLPTFKVNYVLSCHKRVPDTNVKKVLAQILRLTINKYFARTVIDISHNKTSAPDHPIAIDVYKQLSREHSEFNMKGKKKETI